MAQTRRSPASRMAWPALCVAFALLAAIAGCGGKGPAVTIPAQGEVLIGDLDGDGQPGVADAIAILRIVVGLQPPTATADATCDGAVTVADAIALLRCVVGLATWPIICVDRFDGSPTISGVPVFPNDNPWNTDISSAVVHPNSDAYMASIGLDAGLHPDFGTFWEGRPIGFEYIVVDAAEPRLPVTFDYADESDPGPYPIPLDAPIEGGSDSDGDRHVLALDTDSALLYELYNAWPQAGSWHAGSGAVFDLTSNDLRPDGWTSADAAGLPILPGLVRYDEVEAGEVRHALRFTCARTQRAYIHPATHWASSSTDASLPPMGLRVRLKAGYSIAEFSPRNQVILTALKHYGMFVADNGGNWYVSGVHDTRWDDEELGQLKDVPGSAFEAIYTGPLVRP